MKNMVHSKKRMLGAAAVAACMILAVMFTACDKDQPTKEAAFKVILPAEANGNSVKLQGTATTFKRGETVTLNVTVAQGWAITSLSLSEGTLSPAFSASGRTYTFAMPDSDVTVTAAWKEVQEYTITVGYDNLDGDGTATTSPSGKQWEDSEVVVTTVPNGTSYALDVVVKRADGTAVPTRKDSQAYTNTVWRFTMPASNVTVTVRFESTANLPYDITYNITPTGAGKVQGPDMFSANQQVSVSLIPGANYKLKGSTVTVSPGDIQAVRDGDTDTWKFMMPSGAATVAVNFAAKQPFDLTVTELDAENDGATAVFAPAPTAGKMLEGTSVTLTVTITDPLMKIYNPGDVVFTCLDDQSFDPGTPTGNGPYVWTFIMPEAAVDVEVTLTDTPTKTYTLTTIFNDTEGAVTTDPDTIEAANAVWTVQKSKAGPNNNATSGDIWVGVQNEVRFSFNKNDFKIIPSGNDNITFTGIATANKVDTAAYYGLTFEMPNADISFGATIQALPSLTITEESASNGNFSWTSKALDGSPSSFAREGYEITITTSPNSGYKTSYPKVWKTSITTPTAQDMISVTQNSPNRNEFTFTMPDEGVTISVEFSPAGALKIYSNGDWATSGQFAIVASNLGTGADQFTRLSYDEEHTVTVANKNGTNTKALEIRKEVVGEETGRQRVAFSIKATTAVDLQGTGGLMFQLYHGRDDSAVTIGAIRQIGFGDSKRMVWKGAANNADFAYYWDNDNATAGGWNQGTNAWKTMFVPAPKAPTGEYIIEYVFSFNGDLDTGEFFLIDDIEFVSGADVQLTGISTPATTTSLEVGADPVGAINLVTRTANPQGVHFIYTATVTGLSYNTGRTSATLIHNRIIDAGGNPESDVFTAWGLGADYVFSISDGTGNATLSGTGAATMVTAVTPGSTFKLTLSIDSITSNETTVNILSDNIKILENWDAPQEPELANGVGGYWRLFGWSGVRTDVGVAVDGDRWVGWKFTTLVTEGNVAGNIGWNDQTANLMAGRNFPTAQNLTGFQTISFWIMAHENNESIPALQTETYAFTLYNGTTIGTVKAPSLTYYTDHVATGTAFSEDFTLNGVYKGATKTNGAATWTEIRIPIANLTAANSATLNLAAITGWSISLKTIATATKPQPQEYVVAMDALIAEKP